MLVERVVPQGRERLLIIQDNAPVIEAARQLRDSGFDLVTVCDNSHVLKGVITKSDIVHQISHCMGASCTTAVTSVMTSNIVSCRPDDWLHDVWTTMKDRRLKNIPIIDLDSRPLGILNAGDAMQMLLQEVEQEETLLREYVMCVGYR